MNGNAETLKDLCDSVVTLEAAYSDVAERIEDLAYAEYGQGGTDAVVSLLENISRFFEGLRNKNEEVSRDLSQIYLLIGQIFQYAGEIDRSIEWINKSIIVDDMYPVPYHSLALSYRSIGDTDLAIKSLEQEIRVAPGNYYTYLLLADLYEKRGKPGELEDVLKRLLERDPDNIQGIHRLIRFYERVAPCLDVELLRRRLLERASGLSRIETVIRAYHLCVTGKSGEAVGFLDNWSQSAPDVSISHLAKAHIYGQMRQYSKERFELSQFKRKNQGRESVMEIKLAEFASVFGTDAAEELRRGLRSVHPVSF